MPVRIVVGTAGYSGIPLAAPLSIRPVFHGYVPNWLTPDPSTKQVKAPLAWRAARLKEQRDD